MVLPEAPGQRRCYRKDHDSMSSAMIMRPFWTSEIWGVCFVDTIFVCWSYHVIVVQSTTFCKIRKTVKDTEISWSTQEKYGVTFGDGMVSINAALCNDFFCATRSPVVVDLRWSVCELWGLWRWWSSIRGHMPDISWYVLQPLDNIEDLHCSPWDEDWWKVCCPWCDWWLEELKCQDTIVEENVVITMWLFFPLIAVVDGWLAISVVRSLWCRVVRCCNLCEKMRPMPSRNISILDLDACRSKLPGPQIPNRHPNCMQGRVESPLMPGLIGWLRG